LGPGDALQDAPSGAPCIGTHPETAGSAAFDRAEYSLQQGSIVIALVVGGTALASVGVLRLTGAGFVAMPRRVAQIVLVTGIAVVAFGVVLISLGPPDDEPSAIPRATLEPASDDPKPSTDRGVRGTVVTQDGDAIDDVKVTLVPLFMEAGVDPLRTRTDADGDFSFDDVDVDPGSPWIAEATFDGVRFPSAALRAPRGPDAPLRIVVAPTTKSEKDVRIDVESVAVVGDKSGGQAVHALTVTNDGQRAYVGGLRLPLLPGATAIQEGTGLDRRYLELGEGEMTSRAPILPGRHDLTYTYIVQMSDRGIAIAHRTQLPTERYEVLVGGGITLSARGGLRQDGHVELGPGGEQRTYARYVARDLDRGDRVDARVAVASGPDALRIGGFVLAALLAIAVIAAPVLRRRRRTVSTSSSDDASAAERSSTPA
jgi:hypothetical protein